MQKTLRHWAMIFLAMTPKHRQREQRYKMGCHKLKRFYTAWKVGQDEDVIYKVEKVLAYCAYDKQNM